MKKTVTGIEKIAEKIARLEAIEVVYRGIVQDMQFRLDGDVFEPLLDEDGNNQYDDYGHRLMTPKTEVEILENKYRGKEALATYKVYLEVLEYLEKQL